MTYYKECPYLNLGFGPFIPVSISEFDIQNLCGQGTEFDSTSKKCVFELQTTSHVV